MIKSFAACALTAGLAAAQEYFMLQTLPDVERLVNDLQENGRRRRQEAEDTLDAYQGHYDFEPEDTRHEHRRAHQLHDNREEDNAPATNVQEEDVTICFVKAYARKPLGPPARNVVPMNASRYQNSIPSWHMLDGYYNDIYGQNEFGL